MDAWEFDDVEAARAAAGRLYEEFLQRAGPVGRAVRPRGRRHRPAVAPRRGRALLRRVAVAAAVTVGDETRDVGPGSLVFVAATVPHRFHDITERLELLVVFGPAEGIAA